MELDLETGMGVLGFLEDAKGKIVDHVLDTVFPSARLEVLGASLVGLGGALAKATPDNPLIEPDTQDADLLQANYVQAAGWGKTYAQITQTIEDLKQLLGAPPETEEGRRQQAFRH